MRKINWIVLHCTAGPQDQKVSVILDYWKRVMKWKTPGYHFLIEADGTIHNLVPIEKISNGVAGHNSDSIHIAYIGGVEVLRKKNAKGQVINVLGKPIDNRTDAQIAAQVMLLKKYKAMFPTAKIVGHRDFSPDKNRDGIISPDEWSKACPSFSVREWLAIIKM